MVDRTAQYQYESKRPDERCIPEWLNPHLFRTAAASTAATYGISTPHLAGALLNHTDPRVTEEHHNRARSISQATPMRRS
jgi:hypothetical protein